MAPTCRAERVCDVVDSGWDPAWQLQIALFVTRLATTGDPDYWDRDTGDEA